MKKLIVFDLDSTLAESKASLDAAMAMRLTALLGIDVSQLRIVQAFNK